MSEELEPIKAAPKATVKKKMSKKAKSVPSAKPVTPKRDYTIRYGVIPANQISDSVIVANPNYGEPIGKWGSRPVRPTVSKMKQLGRFYQELEKSIKKMGVQNPIFCNSYKEGTFSRYGTSRLWIAKKLKLEIPCIIADYTGQWDHLEELVTEDDILSKFKDKPTVLEISKTSMRFDGCP